MVECLVLYRFLAGTFVTAGILNADGRDNGTGRRADYDG
jgi:hypothetical protein